MVNSGKYDFRKSMQVLTEKQKNMVYNECMKRNFYVPVHIKFNPQKGRGVYAAYKIHKDDFLMGILTLFPVIHPFNYYIIDYIID